MYLFRCNVLDEINFYISNIRLSYYIVILVYFYFRLPGVHQDIRILEDVLHEMLIAMRCIRKLKGPVSRFYTTEMSPSDVGRCKPIIDAKYTSPLPPFTLHFRPIFTNLNLNMNEAAARLSVEMWQTGFLVFLKLADWALSTNE